MTDQTPALLQRMPMRLVLKHCNDDASMPMALHTEDGRILPCQSKITVNSQPGELVSVIVQFDIYPGGELSIAETPEPKGTPLPPLEGTHHG